MSIVYIALGIYLITANLIFNFTRFQQSGFGGVLILYGATRFYQAMKKKKESESNQDDEE